MQLAAKAWSWRWQVRHEFDRKITEPARWWIINHLPRRVVLWSLYRAGVECCGGPNHPTEVVPEVPFTVVLNRWNIHSSKGATR